MSLPFCLCRSVSCLGGTVRCFVCSSSFVSTRETAGEETQRARSSHPSARRAAGEAGPRVEGVLRPAGPQSFQQRAATERGRGVWQSLVGFLGFGFTPGDCIDSGLGSCDCLGCGAHAGFLYVDAPVPKRLCGCQTGLCSCTCGTSSQSRRTMPRFSPDVCMDLMLLLSPPSL